MIAVLRRRHRHWWILLAIALPLLMLLALSARESVPAVDQLPGVERAPEATG